MKSMCAAAFLLAVSVQGAFGASKEYANIHTIGIISVLGDRIDLRKEGFTVFENAEYKLDLDLKMDEQIVHQIEASLQPQFAVTKVDVDPGVASELAEGVLGQGRLRRQLLALPHAGIDAYIVVLPALVRGRQGLAVDHVSLGSGQSGRMLRGLFGGPLGQLGLSRDQATSVSAFYGVDVYDAATGRRLDYGIAHYPSPGSLLGSEFPTAACDPTIWSDTADAMSDAQKSRLKLEMSALVSRSIAYTLSSAGLIDKSQAGAITAGFDTEGDRSCHPP